MKLILRLAAAALAAGGVTRARGQGVTDYVNYTGGTYIQSFDTLPDPGATSVNTAPAPVINGITYTLPLANALPFALDDPTIGSGGASIGGKALAGWYGADLLIDRLGATFGDQTTGGLLDFGLASSSNRALGLISTSTTGAAYLGVAIKNNTGIVITAVNLSFIGELWKQGTFAKTFLYGYTLDNTATSNLLAAATSSTAVTLGKLTAAPTVIGPVDGTNPANQTPVALTNVTLTAPWQPGGILWFTAQISDPTGSGQGFGLDNFTFSAVGAPGITTQPLSQTANAGATIALNVVAAGATAYQWQFNGANLPGANSAGLTLANIGTNQGGNYTVLVTVGTAQLISNAAVVTVNAGSHPVNVSARGDVGAGASSLIAGFVVAGATSETLLIRGIGPGLGTFGVAGPLAAPQLAVFGTRGNLIASNTGWGGTAALVAAFGQVGAFPLAASSADDALIVTLPPGAYTAQVTGAAGGTGIALLEVYDLP